MANMCPYGLFTHAVVRGIPETFGKTAGEGRENGEVTVDQAKAQRQFGCLTGALRQKVGLQLIEIPPDPELPESWRIEDVAVIQGDTALITRPFKQQRRSEADAVRRVMSELSLTVVEMGDEQGDSGGATLEGSDVLFTGREFFVGISSHTNRRGAEVLADTFRDFAVSTVPVCGGARLKNFCSMGGPDTIIISGGDGAKKTLRVMEQLTDHHYDVLTVPEESAANCIYVKGPSKRDFLLHRPAEEIPCLPEAAGLHPAADGLQRSIQAGSVSVLALPAHQQKAHVFLRTLLPSHNHAAFYSGGSLVTAHKVKTVFNNNGFRTQRSVVQLLPLLKVQLLSVPVISFYS